MFVKALRLLEYQQRLERAEIVLHFLHAQLREQPEEENLREHMRSAYQAVLIARRSLMDVIMESSESTLSTSTDVTETDVVSEPSASRPVETAP